MESLEIVTNVGLAGGSMICFVADCAWAVPATRNIAMEPPRAIRFPNVPSRFMDACRSEFNAGLRYRVCTPKSTRFSPGIHVGGHAEALACWRFRGRIRRSQPGVHHVQEHPNALQLRPFGHGRGGACRLPPVRPEGQRLHEALAVQPGRVRSRGHGGGPRSENIARSPDHDGASQGPRGRGGESQGARGREVRRALGLSAPLREPVIEAPGPRAVAPQEQVDEAEENRGLAVVLDGPEPAREMADEVGERHLTGQDERNRSREEAQQDQGPAHELQHARDVEERGHRHAGRHSAEPAEKLHASGKDEKKSGHDPKQRMSDTRDTAHHSYPPACTAQESRTGALYPRTRPAASGTEAPPPRAPRAPARSRPGPRWSARPGGYGRRLAR